MEKFYVVSVKHTLKTCDFILLWGPDARGYTHSLERAGKYTHEEIMSQQDYYNNGNHTVAVPCSVIDSLKTTTDDQEAFPGHGIMHVKDNWDKLLEKVIAKPLADPVINYRRAMKAV